MCNVDGHGAADNSNAVLSQQITGHVAACPASSYSSTCTQAPTETTGPAPFGVAEDTAARVHSFSKSDVLTDQTCTQAPTDHRPRPFLV